MNRYSSHTEVILVALIEALRAERLSVGPDVAVMLQRVLVQMNVSSVDDLKKIKYMIVPVVAKSPLDQHKAARAIDHLTGTRRGEVVRRRGVLETITNEINNKKKKLFLLAAKVALLVVIGGTLFYLGQRFVQDRYRPRTRIETFESLVANDSIIFTKINDPDTAYTVWDFGDSTPPLTDRKSNVVKHLYHRGGKFNVVVSNANNRDAISRWINIAQADTCNVTARFDIIDGAQPNLRREIHLKADTVDCETISTWDFDDGSAVVEIPLNKLVTHTYRDTGRYLIEHKVVTRGSKRESVFSKPIRISDTVKFIRLYAYEPIMQKGASPKLDNTRQLAWSVLGLAVLSFLIAYVLLVIFRKQKAAVMATSFPIMSEPESPFSLEFPKLDLFETEKKFNELAFRLRQPNRLQSYLLDVKKTISSTILKAGFPTIEIEEQKVSPEYVFLIEASQELTHFSSLAETVIQRLADLHVKVTVLFYATNIFRCYGEAFPNGIDLERLAGMFHGSRLIIYTSGYSFLNDYTDTGFIAGTERLLSLWTQRAILTPVPRSNWATKEKKLLSLSPLYPATIEGHLLMATGFQSGKKVLPLRVKDKFMPLPVANDPESLSAAFDDQPKWQGQPLLALWCYAMAMPDKINWETTIIVGRAIEKFLHLKEDELVSHDNLLRLWCVSAFQDYKIASTQREYLIEYLKTTCNQALLVNAVYQSLINEYKKLKPKPGSTADLIRNVSLASFEFKASARAAGKHGAFMYDLKQRGLLDSHTAALVSKPRLFASASMKEILVWGTLFLVLFTSIGYTLNLEPNKKLMSSFLPMDTLEVDSTAYYNNILVKSVNSGVTYREALVLMAEAYVHNDSSLNDTLSYNIELINYHQGLTMYRASKLDSARFLFLHLDSLDYSFSTVPSVFPLTSELRMARLHAAGVSDYYLRGDQAVGFNQMLLMAKFYDRYPLQESLRTLLAETPIQQDNRTDTTADPPETRKKLVELKVQFEASVNEKEWRDLALEGKELSEKNGCEKCHQPTRSGDAPTFYEVAEKYPYNQSNVDHIGDAIINGSAGAWGKTEMKGNTEISSDQALKIALYILSFDKEKPRPDPPNAWAGTLYPDGDVQEEIQLWTFNDASRGITKLVPQGTYTLSENGNGFHPIVAVDASNGNATVTVPVTGSFRALPQLRRTLQIFPEPDTPRFESSPTTVDKITPLLKKLPVPSDFANRLAKANIQYAYFFLNNASRRGVAADESRDLSLGAIGLGVGIAHAGYAINYNKREEAQGILTSIASRAQYLYFDDSFDRIRISNLFTENTHEYSGMLDRATLQLQERLIARKLDKDAVLISVGYWIEGLYITSRLLTEHSKDFGLADFSSLLKLTTDQAGSLSELIQLLQSLENDKKINAILKDLDKLKYSFDDLYEMEKSLEKDPDRIARSSSVASFHSEVMETRDSIFKTLSR